jgi:hypothetical protein
LHSPDAGLISTASSWFSFVDRCHVGVGLLDYRELDDALELTTMAGEMLAEARTGRNIRHALVRLLRRLPIPGISGTMNARG